MKRVRIRPLGFPFLLNTALPAAFVAPGMTLRQAFFARAARWGRFPAPVRKRPNAPRPGRRNVKKCGSRCQREGNTVYFL